MIRKKGEIQRKRIIVYYVLAIVLPCLILGILAFRGIQNDQALVEREQRRKLTEAGQQIIKDTEDYLSSVENSLAGIIGSVGHPETPIFKDQSLDSYCLHYRVVAGVIYRSVTGIPSLLNHGLIYIPDHLESLVDQAALQSRHFIWEGGWQIEFREKNYPKALLYYQGILKDASDEQSRGEILNAIARIQKKLGQDDAAMETYNSIWESYPRVLIRNKIPLGAVALMENSLLYLKQKDTLSALRSVHTLLTQLQLPLWELGASHYANLKSGSEEIISQCHGSPGGALGSWLQRIQSVKDSISKHERQTEYLLALLENHEDVLNHPEMAEYQKTSQRLKTSLDGRSYLVSLIPGENGGVWELILDPGYILDEVVHSLILEREEKSKFYWEVTSVDGGSLLNSDHIPEDAIPEYLMFPSDLPSWTLALYPKQDGLFAALFSQGKGFFLYVFIAIIFILAAGLFFTLQTVSHELYLSRMKSYFMSTVSHEFKSPLTSIRQMAEMLVRGRVPSQEKQQKYHTAILQQSERLSHLIDNILDFSKMEEGQKNFRFEKANVAPVVKDMVESFRNLTSDMGFQINLDIKDPLPDMVFDREAMEQVIHNLIDNACKYSDESKLVEVQLYPKGNNVVISVRDQGIGIRKEDHDKIFSRFYRAGEELTQTVKGSGIGLTIVKQIVEAHKGKITLESSPGRGSIFTIILPVSQS